MERKTRKRDVEVGQVWLAKVGGNLVKVQVTGQHGSKFSLKNLTTGRDLPKRRTAAFLRVRCK